MDTIRVIAQGLRFPEGPVWMRDGSVAFVEIEKGTVSRVDAAGNYSVIAHTGGGPNGLAIGPDGAFYVCNNGGFIWTEADGELRPRHGVPASYTSGSIQRIDPTTNEVTTLYSQCNGIPLFGPNDLVFDGQGGFYFSDLGKNRGRDRDVGSVYYALADGSHIIEVIHPIANPNGVGLSPDGRSLYVSETETARLWAYAIQSPGKVELLPYPSPNGGRLLCGLPGYHRLDSLAVQANGDICVGTLVSGQVTVVTPQGDIVRQIPFPDRHTTNICFGGPDLRKAYVTLSITGQLVEMDWPETGLRLNYEA
jgi:gluconolactonase